MTTRAKRFQSVRLFFWIIASVAVAAMIFRFSAQNAPESNEISKDFLRRLLMLFLGGSPDKLILRYNHNIRKAAHFSVYALLGFCLTGVYHHQKHIPTVFAAIATAALYAATDELHQSFVPGRGPQLTDVLLDTCGATLGTLIMALTLFLLSRKTRKHSQ